MHMEFPSKFTQAESQNDNPTSSTKVKQLSSDNKKWKPKQKTLHNNKKNYTTKSLKNVCIRGFWSAHYWEIRENLKNERQFWCMILSPLKNPILSKFREIKKEG